jgi:YD repeat-containing protein
MHQHAEARPVEATDTGSHLEANIFYREYTTTKNVLEDGQLVVERYDQAGNLIRRTPPGYLPIDKMI